MRLLLEHRADLDAGVQAVAQLQALRANSTAASVNFFCTSLWT